jgi:hypothetical protein
MRYIEAVMKPLTRPLSSTKSPRVSGVAESLEARRRGTSAVRALALVAGHRLYTGRANVSSFLHNHEKILSRVDHICPGQTLGVKRGAIGGPGESTV